MKKRKTTLLSWYDIVNNYTTRHISIRKDTLIGISAIAKVIAEEMGQPPSAYKAGLWEHDFHRGLLWRRFYNSGLPLIRHAEYIAPSWSWASNSASLMPTRRIYSDPRHDNTKYQLDAEIKEIIIDNENDNHFGIINKRHVKLSGPTLKICRHKIPSIFWDCPEHPAQVSAKEFNPYSYSAVEHISEGSASQHFKFSGEP
ncbi:hypothetical protein BPOR_0645g00080 [Botrytis porri]|uniref:Uncharacterized protein n=1 Tax=Botrytis porri TaxID=87229 RepID=A0A4Z1KDI7_9HELO|nr:hypothetical protein BPOR_0645g00080 [Botrytis porri]